MLINLITSAIIAIVLFYCAFLGYKEGLRLGMQATKGIEPQKIRSPVQVIQQMKQEHEQSKADKKFEEGLSRLMNYTGEVEEE